MYLYKEECTKSLLVGSILAIFCTYECVKVFESVDD